MAVVGVARRSTTNSGPSEADNNLNRIMANLRLTSTTTVMYRKAVTAHRLTHMRYEIRYS